MSSMTFDVSPPANGFPRLGWVEPCEIRGAGCAPTGQVWNLSATGAYVVANPIPSPGETLQISFRLPDGSAFEGPARVAWRNQPSLWKGCGAQSWKLPPGCGVEFLAPLRTGDAEGRSHEGQRAAD